jgi:hypothetical protein
MSTDLGAAPCHVCGAVDGSCHCNGLMALLGDFRTSNGGGPTEPVPSSHSGMAAVAAPVLDEPLFSDNPLRYRSADDPAASIPFQESEELWRAYHSAPTTQAQPSPGAAVGGGAAGWTETVGSHEPPTKAWTPEPSAAGAARRPESTGWIGVVIGALAAVAVLLVGVLPATSRWVSDAFGHPVPAATLSHRILSQALPGMDLASNLPENGPLTSSNSAWFGPTVTSDVNQQLARGELTGYLRAWRSSEVSGDGAVVIALSWKHAEDGGYFLEGVERGAALDGASSFPAPGVPGAIGYTETVQVGGQSLTEHMVTFARSNTAVAVVSVSASDDIPTGQVLSLAAQQAASFPGSVVKPSTTPPSDSSAVYRFGEVIGSLALTVGVALLPIWLARRLKRKGDPQPSPGGQTAQQGGWDRSGQATPHQQTAPVQAWHPEPVAAAATTSHPGPSWHPDPYGGPQLRWWDGEQWTEHLTPVPPRA